MAKDQDDSFNTSQAEVFDALGHPTRMRLLQTLSENPLPFSELKRAAGLESNGLLTFHLGRLRGLVRLNPEGAYALTDEGREALRMIEVSRTSHAEPRPTRPAFHPLQNKAVLTSLVVILVALVAVSAMAGYYAGTQAPARTTTTVTSTVTSTTTTPLTTPAGITLELSVNGTTINEGQNLAITATLLNVLGQNNSVAISDNWPIQGLLMFNNDWPPCYYYSPVELVVLKGNYTQSQLLAMGPGRSPNFGCFEDSVISHLKFEPNGDLVYVTSTYSVTGDISTYGPLNASVTVTTDGYWDNSINLIYPTPYASLGQYNFLAAQHSFVQGVYTVAVGDEWGQLDVVHLIVG